MSAGARQHWVGAMARAIRRSIFFTEAGDSDISKWLEGHPPARFSSDLPGNCPAPSLLYARLLSRERREVCATTPTRQKVDFEAPTQVLGVGGVLVAASVISITADRIRNISLLAPDYYSPGFFSERTRGFGFNCKLF